MLIPVLIVSSLVHIYSISYMSHDPHNQRFFSYLSNIGGRQGSRTACATLPPIPQDPQQARTEDPRNHADHTEILGEVWELGIWGADG